MNTNTAITGCTSLLTNATSAFATLSTNATSPKFTSAQVKSTLGNLCSSSVSDACPTNLVGGIATAFYAACSVELTSNPNDVVVNIYDTLYIIIPLLDAICTLDDGGNYCSMQAKLPSSTTGTSLQKVLSSPSSANSAALIPNTTTFHNTNLPFLFLDPSANATSLCNVCTRKVVNAYVTFEASVPYGPGLGKSPLLSSQLSLYTDIQKTCGSSFLDSAGVVKAAGGLSGGTLSSGATAQTNGPTQGLVAIGMGILALVASSVL